jgi:hypothetical protein
MPKPFILLRRAAIQVLTILDPPDDLLLRGVHVDTGVAIRADTGDAGRHGRTRR